MSDYETAQRKRNIIVGIFVIIAMCALVWLIYSFGDLPGIVSEAHSFQVFVQFPTATGVQRDTPVRFCGYQIGRVTKVMAPEIRRDLNTNLEYHQTVVVLSIDKKHFNIPSNVEVKLMTRGLGSSYIELKVDPAATIKPLDPNRPETRFLVDNLCLQGSTGMTSEFFPEESQAKLDGLANSLIVLIDNFNDILGDKENKEHIEQILTNVSQASAQATQTLKEFETLSVAGVDMAEKLSKTIAELRLILVKINTGQSSVAKVINDGRLYENLLEGTNQLLLLLQEVRQFIAEYREKGIKVKL